MIKKIAFLTLISALATGYAQDLSSIQVGYQADYVQNSSAAPVGASYGASFYVTPASGSIQSAYFTFDGNHTPSNVEMQNENGEFVYYQSFNTSSELFEAFGNTLYDFDIVTDQGSYATTVDLGGATFPETPTLTGPSDSWSAGSLLIGAEADYTFSWNAFNSAQGSDDAVSLTIYDGLNNVAWSTTVWGAQTEVTMPLNKLIAGQTYTAYLSFNGVRYFEPGSAESGGAALIGVIAATTEFSISAVAVPEPGTNVLFAIGLSLLIWKVRRSRSIIA